MDRSIKNQITNEGYGFSIDYKPYAIFSIDTNLIYFYKYIIIKSINLHFIFKKYESNDKYCLRQNLFLIIYNIILSFQ